MKTFEKLGKSPNISSLVELWWKQYALYKAKSFFLRIPLSVAEFVIRNFIWFWTLLDSKLYLSRTVEIPISVLDDYLCSQIDFFEDQLSKRKGTRYLVAEGGFLHKLWLLICLSFRVAFVIPRLCWKLTVASLKEVKKDSYQTFAVLCRLLGTPVKVRRSTRIRKARIISSPSKDKKRKRDESDGEIEEYFAIDETYCSEDDPDYSIGESSFVESEDENETIELDAEEKTEAVNKEIEEKTEKNTEEVKLEKEFSGDDKNEHEIETISQSEAKVEKEMTEILNEVSDLKKRHVKAVDTTKG